MISKEIEEFRKKVPSSHPQTTLFRIVKSQYPDAELNYPIEVHEKWYFIDIYIPSHIAGIEYDGKVHELFSSKKRKKDIRRTNRINGLGIKLIRVNRYNAWVFILQMDEFVEGSKVLK